MKVNRYDIMLLVIFVKKDKIYLVSFIVLLLDQMIKFIITKNMQVLESIAVIPNFFQIHYIQNEGAAWGILNNQTLILTLISALALILLNRYLQKETTFTKLSVLGYGLLMGGMMGNLIDRILHNHVIDYLDFHIFGYDFPVFNLADIGIVIGIFLLLYEMIRSELHEHRSRKRKS